MTKFYMMVGIPGSGKSKIAKELGVKVYSSDELRKELWGNEGVQGDNNEIFTELHKRIKESLRNGESCVLDATNIRASKRAHFLKEIKNIECEKICIMVASDINVCLVQNDSRDRNVPHEVIKRMYFNIEIPQYREGWDKIVIKRHLDKNNEYDIEKYIEHLKGINHNNPHHSLTIGNHIEAVEKYIYKNYKSYFGNDTYRLKILMRAAMYHDVGKEITKTYLNAKGEETEVAHYYGHEYVSAYMYLLYENELDIENNLDDILYVADLIGLHMRLHYIGEGKGLDKIKQMVGEKEFEDLTILNEADTVCK